eukprot:CAMPEP_0178891240 /NCGR_PEP_ID=MMETSP0747-20121128/18808_1 /TAXON_ID=913974 /ORGANISM="Nitzschia punctata, Strain CCMP561" /LENGTH=221 /DNA_ID=CAMNT_0020561021 /DNA_START=127 /DNA_END=792 /DNA_ORIENTATION=-
MPCQDRLWLLASLACGGDATDEAFVAHHNAQKTPFPKSAVWIPTDSPALAGPPKEIFVVNSASSGERINAKRCLTSFLADDKEDDAYEDDQYPDEVSSKPIKKRRYHRNLCSPFVAHSTALSYRPIRGKDDQSSSSSGDLYPLLPLLAPPPMHHTHHAFRPSPSSLPHGRPLRAPPKLLRMTHLSSRTDAPVSTPTVVVTLSTNEDKRGRRMLQPISTIMK